MMSIKYIITVLITCLLLALGLILYQLQSPSLDFTCSSLFRQENFGNDYHMKSNTLFTFTPDMQGFISLDGTVIHDKKEYTLRRDYRFRYSYAGGNKWQLHDVAITFAGSDNVPVGMVEKNFYSVEKKKTAIYIYIAGVVGKMKTRIIGGLYSPAFMCVNSAGEA